MRILIAVVIALAVMAGLVLAIVALGAAVTTGARGVLAQAPVTKGTLAKVAFGVLWVLVAGVSSGLIGSG